MVVNLQLVNIKRRMTNVRTVEKPWTPFRNDRRLDTAASACGTDVMREIDPVGDCQVCMENFVISRHER